MEGTALWTSKDRFSEHLLVLSAEGLNSVEELTNLSQRLFMCRRELINHKAQILFQIFVKSKWNGLNVTGGRIMRYIEGLGEEIQVSATLCRSPRTSYQRPCTLRRGHRALRTLVKCADTS